VLNYFKEMTVNRVHLFVMFATDASIVLVAKIKYLAALVNVLQLLHCDILPKLPIRVQLRSDLHEQIRPNPLPAVFESNMFYGKP